MTSVVVEKNHIKISLSKSEAIILFEFLSRNWEKTQWNDQKLFIDPAEKQMLIWLEADLESVLEEPFSREYKEIVKKCYRDVVQNPADWS